MQKLREVDELQSSQEEADTRIIIHCMFKCKSSRCMQDSFIIVKSPDTDVLVLLTYFVCDVSQTVLFDTNVANNSRLINVSTIDATLGREISNALMGFHAFTGCDSTSAFVRKGMKGPCKLMKSNPEFLAAFSSLGETPDTVPFNVELGLKKFVSAMYCKTNELGFKVQERYR